LKKTVVIIDDEIHIVEVMVALFESEEYELIGFHNADEAVSYVNTHEVAAVFCDYRMPGITGLELSKCFKPGVRFFIISGDLELDLSSENTVFATIQKPFEVEDLLSVLEGLKHAS